MRDLSTARPRRLTIGTLCLAIVWVAMALALARYQEVWLALDAHMTHPEPFIAHDLEPYQDASAPPCQVEALHRRKIMRKARAKKNESSCSQHWKAGT